jgi:outer membrane receptor for ferrienterochelin and colicin
MKLNFLGVRFFLIKTIFLFPFFLFSQNPSLSGWISDAETGERLIGANIQELNTKIGTQTDNYGFFSIKCPKYQQRIRVGYIGFESDTLDFQVRKDTILQIKLRPRSLREVTISAKSEMREQGIGIVQIPIAELKSRPILFGEPDIIKALTLTPGVKSGTEGTTGLYIRGGTPDQNLILLDGATVYNNSHLFGFVSVFNPDAVKAVSLYKGQMPARYGGRLSSVLDISMKEGNNETRKSELAIGLISSRFMTEGPIKKGKSSYLFSGRSSYLGLLALPSRISFNNGNKGTYANYWMYDVNGKINFDLGKNSRFYLSFYSGKDDWKALSRDNLGRNDLLLNWGNQTASARFNKLLNSKVFFNSQLTYNRYRYSIGQSFFEEQNPTDKSAYFNRSFVQDITFKNSVLWSPATKHSLEAGVEYTLQTLDPQSLKTEGIDSFPSVKNVKYNGNLWTIYVEDRYSITSNLRLTMGVRGGIFKIRSKQYNVLEPRTNLLLQLTERINFEISWRQNNQPIHLLTSNGIGLPNDVWVPATSKIPPAKSSQWSAGISNRVDKWSTIFSIETYYRTMQNLIDFRQGVNLFGNSNNWEEIVVSKGKGRAYGFELMAHRQKGDLNGWVSYTLAWNDRKFASVNRGNWFPHQYDRRHEISITGNYKISEKWTASSNFVFTTGNAFSAPSYLTVVYNDPNLTTFAPIFVGKNNRRGPVYHRLDFSMVKTYQNKRNRTVSWAFGVYNVYAHNNPFYLDVSVNQYSDNIFNNADRIKMTYQVGSIFNFIPSISYAVKFK